MKKQQPLLSIGIIFKNEIRCLERCLKSFEKLRKAVPCEIVMADTGSDDGSREVAEKYADIVFDFPWINDFSAARNAVMDRCSGKWQMTVDADEWLDEDITELVSLVKSDGGNVDKVCWVIVRNYMSQTNREDYGDFYGGRICRMSSGLRYEGAVHESWPNAGQVRVMFHTILHHDGYAIQNAADWKKKRKRNMELIRQELKESPDDLKLLMQCTESGQDEPDYLDLVKRAMEAVEAKKEDWEAYGPPIFRQAVRVASWMGIPTFDAWVQRAEELFPRSDFIRIDVQYLAFAKSWTKKNYEDCVRRGENYLSALEDNRAGRGDVAGKVFSTLSMAAPAFERHVQVMLAGAYLRTGRTAQSVELLERLEPEKMNDVQLKNYALLLQELHGETDTDTTALVEGCWEKIFETDAQEETEKKEAEIRRNTFLTIAGQAFDPAIRTKEPIKENFRRYAYTLYLPLRDQCDLGRSAAILASENTEEMTALLERVEDWNGLSIHAMVHALEQGVRFPLPDKPLMVEEMDSIALRLAKSGDGFFRLALRTAENADMEDWQELCWARGVVLTAARTYPWADRERSEEQGMALVRAFAKIEQKFLGQCYTAEVLRDDRLFALPPMHRFGWYCVQAFEALEQGSSAEYVRLLRAGLDVCESMKDMVEFLMEQVREGERAERIATAPPELITLADQVKVMLARFAPDDPAVAELKRSPAYQQVAWLIERPAGPAFGNITQ